jgi:para-nitrobenzyl esterase
MIPTDPIGAIAAGSYNKVPVLASNTADEGKLFAPFLTLLGGLLDSRSPTLRASR